jgi:hypothetical protein
MKILLVAFLLFISIGTTHAQLPQTAYIGLFADENHTSWCVNGEAFYGCEVWVWVLTSERGVMCVEFKVEYPDNVIQSTITQCWGDITLDIEDPTIGYSACVMECRLEWFCVFGQQLYVVSAEQTHLEIVPHVDVDAYQVANCEPGYPIEPVIKLTDLYVNREPNDPVCAGVGTGSASWGAIKRLMSD